MERVWKVKGQREEFTLKMLRRLHSALRRVSVLFPRSFRGNVSMPCLRMRPSRALLLIAVPPDESFSLSPSPLIFLFIYA
eukprot:4344084-Pleurochrysis_carterae.AAC.1